MEKSRKVELILRKKKTNNNNKKFSSSLIFLHKAKKQDKIPARLCALCWSPLQAGLYLLEGIQNNFKSNLKGFAEKFPASLAHPALVVVWFLKMWWIRICHLCFASQVVDNAYWLGTVLHWCQIQHNKKSWLVQNESPLIIIHAGWNLHFSVGLSAIEVNKPGLLSLWNIRWTGPSLVVTHVLSQKLYFRASLYKYAI